MVKRIRAIYERWPDFRERLPEVWAAQRDTSVPPSSRLTRAWQIVDRHLLNRPEWLSSRTESLRDIRFRRQRAERIRGGEKFHRWLHGLHTFARSLWLGGCVFGLALVVSVSVGTAFADADASNHLSSLAGLLVAIAGVLGGAAGILFAVIVFGIQFHGQKLDQAAFLVRYLRRREGLIPIAAFTLGVVAANVIVSLICFLGLPYAAVPMAILDVPLVLAVLCLVLWLLYRMTASVSDDFVTLLTPSITWEYDRALDEDIHHARQRKVFEEAVEEAGLEYSTVGGYTTLDRVAPIKLNLSGCGSVVDVNLTALKSLGEYIQSACPDHDGKLCVGPGDAVDNTVALVLSASRDDQGRQKQDADAIGEEVVEGLRRRLLTVFRLGSVRERDVVDVLSRFEDVLVSYARHDSSEQLERGLEIQETLVKRGLARADAVAGQFSIHRERLPDFLAGFNFFDMAKHAVASGDREKVSALLTFSCRMMGQAVQRLHPGLYYRAGEIIVCVYYRAIEGKELADYVGESLDSWLSTLGSQFEYAHSSWRRDSPKIAAQIPVQIADLGWRLSLIKTATEAGRTTDATNFQERLFEWDRHSHVRLADPNEEKNIPAEVREACDLISYANLIVAAWCLYLFETGHKHAETAKTVFQRCASALSTREHFMLLWEAVRGKRYGEKHIDELLGITPWTLPSPRRVGVSVGGWGGDAWIERGFIALLLKRRSAREHERPVALGSEPEFRPKNPEDVKTLANAVLGNEALRKGLLDITDDKCDETLDAVVALFGKRLRLFKLDRLAAVVSAPLLDEHCSQLQTQIAKGLEEEQGLTDLLEKLGGLQNDAISWFWPRAEEDAWLPKESVANPSHRTADFAPLVAQTIQNSDNMQAYYMAEMIAEPTTAVGRLTELADAVRAAITQLRRTTENPILVFVPRQRHIFEALVGQKAWHLPNRCSLGDHHRGEWEGCQLVQFPYFACSSVVVMDAHAFYGAIRESASARLDLEIQHPNEQEHDKWLRDAQAESDPTKIPEPSKVKVLVVTRMALSVGLNDPKAALRVDLDLTRIGFALVESESVYHRPDCSLLSAAKSEIVHTLAHRLQSDDEQRTPCEHCRPDEWEEQAEQEVQDAIAVE